MKKIIKIFMLCIWICIAYACNSHPEVVNCPADIIKIYKCNVTHFHAILMVYKPDGHKFRYEAHYPVELYDDFLNIYKENAFGDGEKKKVNVPITIWVKDKETEYSPESQYNSNKHKKKKKHKSAY